MAKTRIKQPAIEAAQDKAEVTAFIRKIGDLQREVKRLETEAGDKKAVVAAVLAWLSEKSAFAEFVRTKKEIDKDAILNQKERFSDGQVPGIKIVSGVEDFVIEPTEQELA